MKICSVDGCGKPYWASGYCRYHINMFYRRGKIVDRNRRSKNDIIDCGDYCEIILCDTYGDEVARTQVDKESVPLLSVHKWYLSNQGYATTRLTKNKQARMHSFLIEITEGMEVDHKDRNPLNNCKSNLRSCTKVQNMANRICTNKNKSGFRGISKRKNRNKWASRITFNHIEHWLGSFSTIEEAILARVEAEKIYFGEFSPY